MIGESGRAPMALRPTCCVLPEIRFQMQHYWRAKHPYAIRLKMMNMCKHAVLRVGGRGDQQACMLQRFVESSCQARAERWRQSSSKLTLTADGAIIESGVEICLQRQARSWVLVVVGVLILLRPARSELLHSKRLF